MMSTLFFILSIIGIVSVIECTNPRVVGGLVDDIENLLNNLLNSSCPTCSTTSSPSDSTTIPTDSTTNPSNSPTCEICNFTDYIFMECFNTSDICLRLTEERMLYPPYPIPQPIPYPIHQPIPYPIHQPIPYPIPQPIPYPIPQPIPYPIHQPIPYHIHQPIPYPIPPLMPYPIRYPLDYPFPIPPYPCSPPCPPYPCSSSCPPFPPESTSTTTTTSETTSPSTATTAETTSPSTATTAETTSPTTTTEVPTTSTSSPECLPFNVTVYINKLCSANETKTIGEILQCIGSLPNTAEDQFEEYADCLVYFGENIDDKIAQKEIVCEDIGTIIEDFESVLICFEETKDMATCEGTEEAEEIIGFCFS